MARVHSSTFWVGLVLGLGALAIGCTNGSDRTDTTTETTPPSTIAVSTSSGAVASTPVDLADELLVVWDLPTGIVWEPQMVSSDFWDEHLTFPLTVEWCSVAVGGDEEHHYKIVSVPPLGDMADRAASGFVGGRAGFNEVVYADTEDAIALAFEAVAGQMAKCLDTFDPTKGFTPEAVEEGWYWEADRHFLPQVGDESYAITYSAFDSEGHSTTYWSDHIVAVVRSGERLVLVEMYEGYEDGTVAANDFDRVVESAVNRTKPSSGVGTLSAAELLSSGDLPGATRWIKASSAHFLVHDSTAAMHLCRDLLTFTTSEPLNGLQNRDAVTYTTELGAEVHEALYSDSEDEVDAAYEKLVGRLRDCIESPDRWHDDGDPDSTAERHSLPGGYTQSGDHSTLPIVGDDRYGMHYEMLQPAGARMCSHRLGVVRMGNRLAVVELVQGGSASLQYEGADFALIVEAAIERLQA